MDDMLLSELVRKLRLKFSMKDLGPGKPILGMKISRHREKRQLFLSQTDYIGCVLERFVGKHVPPDGRYREPVDRRTGPDRF